MVSVTARRFVQFLNPETAVVTITAPVEAQEIVAEPIPVTWALDAGTQEAYRLQVFDDEDETTLLYDSQWQTSAIQSDDIPGATLDSGATYYVKVFVHRTDGANGVSALRSFELRLPTSIDISGLALSAVGGDCGRYVDADTLPGVLVEWDQIVPGGGETFVRYRVYRRKGGETDWTCIASIATIATVVFTDYAIASRIVYEYAVIWEATVGAETLFSARQTPPPNARTVFDFTWIHDVATPSQCIRIDNESGRQTARQALDFGQTWGRTSPVAYAGEALERVLSINGLDLQRKHPAEWSKFEELVTSQADGTIFCIRKGIDRERMFCAWDGLGKTFSRQTYRIDGLFREVHYDEECGT